MQGNLWKISCSLPTLLKYFWQLYLKNINFLAKTKRCLYAEFYEFKTKLTGKGKQNHIFQKSKSYEISSTVIYISKDQKFIIHVFYWCIPLDHEIYTKCKKKHLTWLKLYLVIISALELKVNKQKNHLSFSTKNFWFFSEFLCSISSSHFRPFNFMCAFNR